LSEFVTNDKTHLSAKRNGAATNLIVAGRWDALHEQLAIEGALCAFSPESSLLRLKSVQNLPQLRSFLNAYLTELLFPVELPTVAQAFHHTCRNEAKELLLLDQKLALRPEMGAFAEASKFVGRFHLQSLASMRGHRLVQKYIAAVQEESAHGWNTTVFGLILGVYSFPLRQGLIRYAEQSLNGFISAGAEKLRLAENVVTNLQAESFSLLPRMTDKVIGPGVISLLK
jgi:urease accessory protein UreF